MSHTKLRYADIVRLRMKTADNPQRRALTIRDLAKLSEYSYEHIRKVVIGEPVVSEGLNEALAAILGINKAKMWNLARYEKLSRKFDAVSVVALAPPDPWFQEVWPRLSPEHRQRIRRVAESCLIESETVEGQLWYHDDDNPMHRVLEH